MNYFKLVNEIVASYIKHGWRLRRVLLRPETRSELDAAMASGSLLFDCVSLQEAEVDGLWFSRASHEGREAWELRLISENAFALFETFEADSGEDGQDAVTRKSKVQSPRSNVKSGKRTLDIGLLSLLFS